MKFIVWCCDRCGLEVKHDFRQAPDGRSGQAMPEGWLAMNVVPQESSGTKGKMRAFHWCAACREVIFKRGHGVNQSAAARESLGFPKKARKRRDAGVKLSVADPPPARALPGRR